MWKSWWGQWVGELASSDTAPLQTVLMKICREKQALAHHLAERARTVRFGPHRLSLETMAGRESQSASALAADIGCGPALATTAPPAPRHGILTASKLIQDLADMEDMDTLYRQARQLTTDGVLRGKLEACAAEEGRNSRTLRGILVRMDSYVTDRQEARTKP
jgi:hypothetical protein